MFSESCHIKPFILQKNIKEKLKFKYLAECGCQQLNKKNYFKILSNYRFED